MISYRKMNFHLKILLCWTALLAINKVSFADEENENDEGPELLTKKHFAGTRVPKDETRKYNNETSPEDFGPPDSHEAMNNRELYSSKHLRKRSYEFLLGLVNNNSKYEITTDEVNKQNSQELRQNDRRTANELLLELIFKLALHPEQWDKVHQLLRNLDTDIKRSEAVINKIDEIKNPIGLPNNVQQNHVSSKRTIVRSSKQAYHVDYMKRTAKHNEESGDDFYGKLMNNEAVRFKPHNGRSTSNEIYNEQGRRNKISYPKTFAYHKVTGKPSFVDKDSKAYIAVSVITPKKSSQMNEELTLEDELRKLKPWENPIFARRK